MIDVGQAAGGFRWARISDRVWLVVKWRFCVLSVCQRGKSIPRDWIISVTQPSDLKVKSLDTKRATLFASFQSGW